MPRLLLYLEDAPVDNTTAAGLSKALIPVIGALNDQSVMVVCQTHEFHKRHFLSIPFERSKHIFVGNVVSSIIKSARKFPLAIAVKLCVLHSLYLSLLIYLRFGTSIAGARMLAPIGTDIMGFVRAYWICKFLHLKFEPYFVDDLEAHPSNRNQINEIRSILRWNKLNIQICYAITDGLAQEFYNRYQLKCKTLPLIVPDTRTPEISAGSEVNGTYIFYLGSINHLYAKGIRELIKCVEQLRSATGIDVKIYLASCPLQFSRFIDSKPDFVTVKKLPSDTQVEGYVREANVCYMPYSFNPKDRQMVQSSFPSKLLQYLNNAKNIIVCAPEYSTAYRLFEEQRIGSVCTEETLYETLLHIIKNSDDQSLGYQATIKLRYSKRTLLRILGL